jgi:hypothetical protein
MRFPCPYRSEQAARVPWPLAIMPSRTTIAPFPLFRPVGGTPAPGHYSKPICP